jgi:hypothetical protein
MKLSFSEKLLRAKRIRSQMEVGMFESDEIKKAIEEWSAMIIGDTNLMAYLYLLTRHTPGADFPSKAELLPPILHGS